MPPPRKPSNVLELKGAFSKNPSRRRKPVKPVAKLLGDAPSYMTEAQAAVYREMLDIMPPGIVKATDGPSVELLACLMCEFREGPQLFTASRIAQLLQLFGRFGLTPSDREKMSIKQEEQVVDEYAEFR